MVGGWEDGEEPARVSEKKWLRHRRIKQETVSSQKPRYVSKRME